ncbi:MAG TPA: hypothetical protein DCQ20_10190, partial [Nitrospira sp.]|nr:hypothetical protein [Nitrospira sp.]
MAADFIHRILRSLQGTFVPTPVAQPAIVDNLTEQPTPPPVRERRIDTRFAVRTPCVYELVEGHGSDASTILGKAYSLNVSSDGILLLLDQKPQSRQLL